MTAGRRRVAISSKMPDTYIVFQDNLKGLTHIPALSGATLKDTIQNITEGCVGCPMPSQHYMYYIYTVHREKVPLFGSRFDVYVIVKDVAGSKVDLHAARCKRGLDYALTDWSDVGWLFADKLFN